MAYRRHRDIREVVVTGPQVFAYDVETLQFSALLVTWTCSATSQFAANDLIFCPTAQRNDANPGASNFPNVPAAPGASASAYAALGLSTLTPLPMPAMVTIGADEPNGVTLSIKVEGDEYETMPDSSNLERQRK